MRKHRWIYHFLHRLYTSLPLFSLYMATYLMLLLVVILCVIPVSRRSAKATRDAFVQQQQYALEQGTARLSNQIRSLEKLHSTFDEWSHYRGIRLLNEGDFQLQHYYDLMKLQSVLQQQFTRLDLPSSGYVVFTRNKAAISSYHISPDAATLFDADVRSALYSSAQLKELFCTASSLTQAVSLGSTSVHGLAPQNSLLLLYKPPQVSAVFGMILQESVLRDTLMPDALPMGAALELLDSSQQPLFVLDQSEPNAKLTTLTSSLYMSGEYRLSLKIPDAYFTQLTHPINQLNMVYIALSICLGIVVSILFTMGNLLPLKRLLRISGYIGEPSLQNEYHALGQVMEDSRQENLQLRERMLTTDHILRASLFTRLLYQEYVPKRERELADRCLPQLSQEHRIVCLQIGIESDEEGQDEYISFVLQNRLTPRLESLGLFTQLDRNTSVLLIAENSETLTRITQTAQAMQATLAEWNATLSIGVSDSFSSAAQVRSAFLHAQFSLQRIEENVLPVYMQAPSAPSDSLCTMNDLSKLQHLILSCNADEALDYLRSLFQRAKKDIPHPESSTTLRPVVQFLLRSLCNEMNLSEETQVLVNASTDEYALMQCTEKMIAELRSRKEVLSQHIIEQIDAYIHAQYTDPGLSMDSIAAHFGVSKSYLYRVSREGGGKSLSERIELIRMERAAHLLQKGTMNVKEVAVACGYNSANTFYKVYKKHFQVSPSEMNAPK